MKARGGRFLLILGAGLAAMAFVVVYILMSRNNGQQAATDPGQPAAVAEVKMRTVAVVNKVVPKLTILDENNVTLVDVDETTLPDGTITSPAAAYGMMSLIDLTAGQPIVANQLTKVSISAALQNGERAFSFPVREDDTFNNGLSESDHVDVLWTVRMKVNVPVKGEEGKISYVEDVYTTTKTILQDVKVLRVMELRVPLPKSEGQEQTTSVPANPNRGMASLYGPDAPLVSVLMLAVTDQEAEVLKFARENGDIDFTLRSSAMLKDANGAETGVKGDHTAEQTSGITIDQMVRAYGILLPSADWLPVNSGTGTAPAPAPAEPAPAPAPAP